MNIDIDLTDYLGKSDVIELCEAYGIEIEKGKPSCFDKVNFEKLSMHDMMKIELFLERFEDLDLATFEKFFHENR